MTERRALGGYIIEYNRNATLQAYSRFAVSGPEACGCWYCRNWVAAREHIMPAAVRQLLTELGIPVNGEIEVWEVPGERTAHLYGGWYVLVGHLIEKPSSEFWEFSLGGWQLSFSSGLSYEVPAFAGLDICELHFLAEVEDCIVPENPSNT